MRIRFKLPDSVALRTRVLWVSMVFLIAPQAMAGMVWDPAWEVTVNGQRLSVETFTTRWAPDAAMRALAHKNAVYERYVVADGRILLSGMGKGAHWLAEVQGQPNGAHGYVSALYFDPEHAPGALTLAGASMPGSTHTGGGTGQAPTASAPLGPLRGFDFGGVVSVNLTQAAGATGVDAVSPAVPGPVWVGGDAHLPMTVAVSMPEP